MQPLARLLLVLSLYLGVIATSAAAKSVEVEVDTSLAARLLELACSGRHVDAAEFERSPLVQAQIAHHSRFDEVFTVENYVQGVETIARCEVPTPDPFRFGSLVKRRETMVRAINFLVMRKRELGQAAAALILPYVPETTNFKGSVVLAPASFSCGGFAQDRSFFVDVPCIAEGVNGEYEAITRLIAHETYHAIQSEFMPRAVEFAEVATPAQAQSHLFSALAREGSASLVGDMRNIKGDGRYAKFSRDTAARNYRHLGYNFRLLGYVTELLEQPRSDFRIRFEELYGLAFDGAFGERGYYVGQQMAHEIVNDFGAGALSCVLSLPPESFVLAYDRAVANGSKLKDSHPLPSAMAEAARRLARTRRTPAAKLDRCLVQVRARSR